MKINKSIKNVNYEKWWDNHNTINRLDPGTRIRKRIINGLLADKKYFRVLDLGCGSGELLEEIKKVYPNKNLYGADLSKTALKILEKKHITERTFICDLEHDRTFPGKYDVIILSEVIEHIKNWKNTINIIDTASKKGSTIIITTQSGKIYPHHVKIGHIKHFELKEITDRLRNKSFRIISAKKIGWPFMNLKNILVNSLLKDENYKTEQVSAVLKLGLNIFYYLYLLSFKILGPQIIIIAEKK